MFSWRDDLGHGLRPFFRSVKKGNDVDYRTPFWEGADRQVVMEMWLSIVEKTLSSSDRVTRLHEIEMAQMERIGPQSVRWPLSKREHLIKGYFRGDWPSVDLELESAAFLSELGGSKLMAISDEKAVAEMRLNTNSGLPHFTRRRDVVPENMEIALRGDWSSIPAILGWRGSASGSEEEPTTGKRLWEDPKQRTLWMFPFSTNIVEMRFFKPWQRKYLRASYTKAWRTPEEVDSAVFRLLKTAREWGNPIFSTDFDSFDQSLGPPMKEWVDHCHISDFQEKDHDLFTEVKLNLRSIPLLVSMGRLLSGYHGEPSGTVWTNGDDTTAHRLAQLRAARSTGGTIAPDCQVQGDDGLLLLRGVNDVSAVLDAYSELGLESNPSKQFVGNLDCTYLQRYYHPKYSGGVYPTFRALNSLLGSERFHDPEKWGADLVSLRALMIVENCKHSPLFPEFVRFVQSGDAFKLGASWPGGIDSLISNSATRRAREIAGFVPSYNQENRIGGIRYFSTYRLIKEESLA